jgi:DNA-binding GntR family transcriptional regulator
VQIDHGSAEFPYLQLAAQLREGITTGAYPAGSKLPTISEITAETGLSPMTIRRAFALLASEGTVRVIPGRGTFVSRAEG